MVRVSGMEISSPPKIPCQNTYYSLQGWVVVWKRRKTPLRSIKMAPNHYFCWTDPTTNQLLSYRPEDSQVFWSIPNLNKYLLDSQICCIKFGIVDRFLDKKRDYNTKFNANKFYSSFFCKYGFFVFLVLMQSDWWILHKLMKFRNRSFGIG